MTAGRGDDADPAAGRVLYDVGGRVATITISRPAKKNAITGAIYTALADGLEAAAADEAVGAIVLTGEGDDFTAGNDLNDFLARAGSDEMPPVRRFMRALLAAQKPLVAAVDGLAIGIGVTLLLHCDIVVVTPRASLRAPFIDLGLVPEFASSLLLPARIGHARAAQMLLLGEAIDGATAQALGLAIAIVEPAALAETARDYARRLAAKPAEAMREARRLMRPDTDALLARMAQEDAVFGRLLSSAEARAAFTRILDKRPPADAPA